MATFTSTYTRIQDATKLQNYTNRFTSAQGELNAIFSQLETMLASYSPGSDEYIEITQKINAGKNLLQNMINSH